MGAGEELSITGDDDPDPVAESSELATEDSGSRKRVAGQTIVRQLGLGQLADGIERLAEMSGDQVDQLLERGMATPLAAFSRARDASRPVAHH